MDEELNTPLQSGRSRDEMLARVVERGRSLQLRRRLMMAALAAMAVILVLPAGVLAVRDDGNEKTQVAASAPTSTTVQVPPTVGGAAEPVSQPPLATPAAAPPTASPPPAAAKPPTTIRRTVPPSSVPTGPAIPACGPAYLEATASSDKLIYQPGDLISLSGTVRNSSATRCTYGAYTFSVRIRALDGREVWSVSTTTGNDSGAPLAPGDALLGAPSPWDRRGPGCGAEPCPPGRYSAELSWSFDGAPAVDAAASFVVSAPPPPPPPEEEEQP